MVWDSSNDFMIVGEGFKLILDEGTVYLLARYFSSILKDIN